MNLESISTDALLMLYLAGKMWSCAGRAGRCTCAVHAPLGIDYRSAGWYPAETDTLSVSLCGFPERGGYGHGFTRCIEADCFRLIHVRRFFFLLASNMVQSYIGSHVFLIKTYNTYGR
ncbi:MAG: hypothetical protein GFH27_549347n42 [Chloroflexi bacterium AL-W]|nr:hypothetical protein [Chloroflexi bacterium AL-N1]NOK70824.1 hypothetical protein [Chloroflexi bacterium AL-N10]NOK78384.1 hypothetical protein [Chloroflexi bacterium AL-N5]NOK85365.1 hypothetical protein [Chloroflexi bacterium AL-W]NOK92641.1 hypothetical protein [Chloroflexi bacterium AL-N15]